MFFWLLQFFWSFLRAFSFSGDLLQSCSAGLIIVLSHIFKKQSAPVTGKYAGRDFLFAAHHGAFEGLFLTHHGLHGAMGAHHIAHEAADAPLLVLNDQIVWSPLQRFTDAGINARRILAMLAQTHERPPGSLEDPDMGHILAGLILGRPAHRCAGFFALPAKIALFGFELECFHDRFLKSVINYKKLKIIG